jgi:anti-sigma regulatory factor (Ser/Thr protein kinase)
LELSAISRPASAPELIGGDFHDVFQLPDGQVALLIGDVEGKGVRAAGTTETVRSAVRALVMISPSPRYVLNNVNRLLLQEQNEQFVTALLLIMDPATGLTYVSSAGHPPPVRIATGETAVVELEPGPPLGTFASEYPVRSLRLAPGERLMLYTDGVTEARAHGELFGEARLVAAVERFRRLDDSELVNNVLATVEGYADELRDDIQIVLVGIGMATTLSADAPSLLHLTIPMAPWRLADVRGSLRDFLRLHEVDEETSRDVILCVEEASSNAIRHGGREEPAELLVSVTRDHVEAEVSDSGRGFRLEDVDVSTAPDLLDEGGRGLFLIHALGEDVQIETDSGTRVRFRKQRRIVHPDRRLAEGPAV